MAVGNRRVAVVGGGVAGLAAVKSCKEEGLDVVGFDSRPALGGLWSDTSDQWSQEGPGVYACLVTNTSKATTCFSDFPCPASYPPYMPHWLLREYLGLYAQHFDLASHFKLNTRVLSVRKSPDHDITGRWTLKLTSSLEESTWEEEFDGVIVGIGFFLKPHVPDVPGLKDVFKGRVIHSKDYREPSPFANKTVLVVGNSSSAADIACDVSHVAKQVYLSVGRGTTLMNRVTPSCLPADLGMKRVYLELLGHDAVLDLALKRAQKQFDHKTSGLLFTGRYLIDSRIVAVDDLPVNIISGKIKILPYVTKYLAHDAVTENGDVYAGIDDVILGTGFVRDLSILDSSLNCYPEKLNLYKQTFPLNQKHQTLALFGPIRAVGAVVPLLEIQARLAALTLSGKHQLPPDHVMKKDVDRMNKMATRPDGSYNYSFIAGFMSDAMAEEIGVKPKFWKLVLSGKPKLAMKCFFGPILPFHYRLTGPGKWPGAEQAIDQAVSESLAPLQSRPIAVKRKSNKVLPVLLMMSLAAAVLSYCAIDQFWSG